MRSRWSDWLAIAACSLLVASCSETSTAGSMATPANEVSSPAAARESTAPKALQVQVTQVEPRRLSDVARLTGELRADEAVELRSEVGGRITAIHFGEGQRVRRGDLLVEINDAELRAELRRAEIERDLARQREGRIGKLLAEATVSQEVYDESASRLQMAEAQIELLRARLAKTQLRAPFAGVVGLRQVSVGTQLTPAMVIATLQSLDPIKVDFSAAEKYAGRIHPGDPIEIALAGSEQPVAGQVYAVEPRIDAASRTFAIRARAANPEGLLLPGAFAEVRLVLAEVENALLVPTIALVPGLDSTSVFVVEEGLANPRAVRTGLRTEDEIQILDGLVAGEQVITSGVQQLRAGSAVAPMTGGDSR